MFCKSLGPVYPEGSGVPGEKSTTPVHPSLVTESVFTRSEVEIVSVWPHVGPGPVNVDF